MNPFIEADRSVKEIKFETPMMAQWYECKKQAKDALLLFRLGDFYEAFYEDAAILAKELGLNLTKRQDVPMSGIPCHTAEGYIEKLVEKGYLVAVAEQMEDARAVKGLVQRKVMRTVSPGTILHSSFLSEKANNFFVSIFRLDALFALAILDLSTGELRALEIEHHVDLRDELFRCTPSEILISQTDATSLTSLLDDFKKSHRVRINIKENFVLKSPTSTTYLAEHFQVPSLDSLGLNGKEIIVHATATLLYYLEHELKLSIDHIKQIQLDHLSTYMTIDQSTQRHLELIHPLHADNKNNTLLRLLDRTFTPMGARLLKSWVTYPLLCPQKIRARQDAIAQLLEKQQEVAYLCRYLKHVGDFERLIMRISTSDSTPRNLALLCDSLEKIPYVRDKCACFTSDLLKNISSHLLNLTHIVDEIRRTLVNDPPLKLGESPTIRPGFHKELDHLTSLRANSHTWIATYQTQLREKAGIKTLKIIYSKAFGYCIEVSRAQASQVPDCFERRQTLINTERFITSELKMHEEKILTAEERMRELEYSLCRALQRKVTSYLSQIKQVARAIAHLDCLIGLMHLSRDNRYCRPVVDESERIDIRSGCHPIIGASSLDGSFIPNDTYLSRDDCTLMLITGPNMAGKSTYIRQVALIVMMAQIGSYVPAESAHIGIVDKIFSRIGASDDLSRGRSTFMVEMSETANILHHATPRSLVILDEIGRGTSTYDGIAIAWSVAEHLLTLKGRGVKTLFATHYWELTDLERKHCHIKNFHVTIQDVDNRVVFLRKIIPGRTDKSYGIHVARLAGFPPFLIQKAEEKLCALKKKKGAPIAEKSPTYHPRTVEICTAGKTIIETLKTLNLDKTTPMSALTMLSQWQKSIISK